MNDSVRTEIARGEMEPPVEVPAARPTTKPTILETFYRLLPAFDSLRTYSLRSLRADLLAGLTVAAVAVPQAMAYAFVIGLPPQYGLYTAIVMTAVGALFDSSKQLINGPTNAISIAALSALAALDPLNEAELVAAAVLLALLVGLAQMGITLLRLGDLSRYISHAVIVGFTVGAGVLLVLDQTKNLLGLVTPENAAHYFLARFWQTFTDGGPIHVWTLVLGLGTVALVVLLHQVNLLLRVRVMPEFLLAVIVMAFVVGGFELEQVGVKVIGTIPRDLPAFGLPLVDWNHVQQLSISAFCIALLGLLEAIAMAKAIAAQTGQKLDINQQCLSEGVANLTGSLFQCFPGSGSLTRSAINQQSGAVSQWSGVFSAVAVAATMFFFADLAYYIPRATLAGILMISAWRMVDRKQLLFHVRATRYDAGLVLATALAAILINIEFCILIGVFLSFVLYVPRAAKLHLTELVLTAERVVRERGPKDSACGRMLIYNLEGELFFGASPDLERHLATIESRLGNGIRIVVLRLKRARNPDAVCLAILDEFVSRLEARMITLFLCGVRRDLAKGMRNTGLLLRLGNGRLFVETVGADSSTLDAVRFAYTLLATDLCSTCPRRDEASAAREPWYYMI